MQLSRRSASKLSACRTPEDAVSNPANHVNLHLDKRSYPASHEGKGNSTRRKLMLWTIFVILLVLWLLGLVSSYTLGGFIHILLVIAVVVLIINLLQGRKSL